MSLKIYIRLGRKVGLRAFRILNLMETSRAKQQQEHRLFMNGVGRLDFSSGDSFLLSRYYDKHID